MLYLISQIALFLALAVILGVISGWWFWGRNAAVADPVLDEDKALIDSKRRLDQCISENAKLRREGKRYKEDLDRLQKSEPADEHHLTEQLEAANAQIQALMDDVQMRDDMILALEKNQK